MMERLKPLVVLVRVNMKFNCREDVDDKMFSHMEQFCLQRNRKLWFPEMMVVLADLYVV